MHAANHTRPGTGGWIQILARGTGVAITTEQAVVVRTGLLALHAHHADGRAVQIGAYRGPEELVLAADGMTVDAVTHATVEVVSRAALTARPDTIDLLWRAVDDLQQAAAQRHGDLTAELHGVLCLHARRFGVPTADGTGVAIDAPLSHSSLARLVSRDRKTVLAAVRTLTRKGALRVESRNSRYVLPARDVQPARLALVPNPQ